MNAAEVRAALHAHYPADRHLVLEECPQDAMRQGRKIDMLVINLWRSRGYDFDAIEIKVSTSDYMKEINTPEKAYWWWHHSNRFSIAVPQKIGARVRETLPAGWGLLVVDDNGKVKTAVAAERHDREELPLTAIIGIMRAASGAGANALVREYDKGVAAGRAVAEAKIDRASGDERLRRKLDDLQRRVDAFETAAGIKIDTHALNGATRSGHLYRLAQDWIRDPTVAADRIRLHADSIAREVVTLNALADAVLSSGETS